MHTLYIREQMRAYVCIRRCPTEVDIDAGYTFSSLLRAILELYIYPQCWSTSSLIISLTILNRAMMTRVMTMIKKMAVMITMTMMIMIGSACAPLQPFARGNTFSLPPRPLTCTCVVFHTFHVARHEATKTTCICVVFQSGTFQT